MHIVLLSDKYHQPGASAGVTAMLAEGYAQQGHRVSVITSHRSEEESTIRNQDYVISLPISYSLKLRHYKCLKQKHVSRMLDDVFRELRPDIVHAHNIHMYLTYDALRIARKYTKNVFITMHDAMNFNYGRLNTKRFLDSEGKDVRTTPLDHIRQAGLQYNPLRNCIIRHILRKNVVKVCAVSHALKSALDVHGIPRTQVVHNGIDTNFWKADRKGAQRFRKKNRFEDRKIILFGGRLSRDKGSTPLLHALNRVRALVPNVMLVVLGDPKRWKGLLQEAHVPANLSAQITTIDWLSREDLRAAYSAANVVTTPSLCLDTFNLMNAEAMACSTPVVGTCFGGTPEVVKDSATGFIRNPLKTEEYAEALVTLLADDTLAKHMGEAGRKRVEKKFSMEKCVETYLNIFADSLNCS